MVSDLLVKRVIYRSRHRGCKETDILLGDFASAEVKNLQPDELTTYERFIDEPDGDIYAWLNSSEPSPAEYASLVQKIQIFHASAR